MPRVGKVVCLRWLLRLLRTYQPCDAQPTAPPQVSELLEKGAKIEAVDKEEVGWTALHLAAVRNDVAAVRKMKPEAETDIEARDKSGRTALHIAAIFGHAAVVREPYGSGRGGPLGSQSEFGPSAFSRSCVTCGCHVGLAVAAQLASHRAALRRPAHGSGAGERAV